jgi:D-alanyl-D-alanine carboxypeptidase
LRQVIEAIARAAAIAATFIGASAALAVSPLGPARTSAILVDADSSRILYSRGAEQIGHPASITKVMTLFLAFDALAEGRLSLTDRVVMTRHAASMSPSKLGLAPGQSLSVEDAIRVIAVKSANDVAVALAERLGGNETSFARMMTSKARSLGMVQTNFANATGLPNPANFTSARDLALLSMGILRTHPDRYRYFGQRYFTYGQQTMTNHNRLLGIVPGVDGIKTGYTVDSGFTLAASATRGGRRLIAIVLGEPSAAIRNRIVTGLLEAGFTALQRRAMGQEADVATLLPGSMASMRTPIPVRAAPAAVGSD